MNLTTTEQNVQALREMREAWTWVEPANITDLLRRLAQGRDIAMPARELENLCAVANGEIKQLLALIDERENLLQEVVDDMAYQPVLFEPVDECVQCGTPKGDRHRPPTCVVGKMEALLRHTEA